MTDTRRYLTAGFTAVFRDMKTVQSRMLIVISDYVTLVPEPIRCWTSA